MKYKIDIGFNKKNNIIKQKSNLFKFTRIFRGIFLVQVESNHSFLHDLLPAGDR